ATVRFVATSATIGEGAETEGHLRKFLADIGGVAPENVSVITGDRRLPRRPGRGGATPVGSTLGSMEPAALYDALGSYDPVWSMVETLKTGSVPERHLDSIGRAIGASGEILAMALARARNSHGETLAP